VRIPQPSVLPGFGLTFGFTASFLCILVLLPLAALVLMTASMPLSELWDVVSSPRALGSYRLSFGASLLAATINLVFGFIIAWTLTRYEFPGRALVDALIDLPFALPTAVSGIALTAVFAEKGWIGRHLLHFGVRVAYTWIGVTVALTLIGLPFAVRSVQPALLALQRELEDAAQTLGAGRFDVFRRIVFPALLPALLTGFTLAFARAVGEYGSVVFISGNLPMKTEITPFLIVTHLQQFEYAKAAALGLVMLIISFIILLTINVLQTWGQRRYLRARH
jgi:sulfate/thiosulfate transport system permease protein